MDSRLNGSFEEMVSTIIQDLTAHMDENHVRPHHLPDKDAVLRIIDLTRYILFPGYFDKRSSSVEYYAGALLYELQEKLQQQVCLVLRHGVFLTEGSIEDPVEDPKLRSARIAQEYIGRIPALRDILYKDVEATLNGDPAARSTHEIILAYPGIYAISVFRMAHELHVRGVPLIPRIMTEHAHSLTGIDIHPGATIGHHFCIDHGTGIVIGETTRIGNYVKIYQGVTLGGLSTRTGQALRGKRRHPAIEDEVTIYSSSSILGGDTVIGKGATVGANVFITQSVPAGSRVSMKTRELNIRGMDT